jgi:hypothetical protein
MINGKYQAYELDTKKDNEGPIESCFIEDELSVQNRVDKPGSGYDGAEKIGDCHFVEFKKL